MSIRPGAEWGEQVDRPDHLVVAEGDAELAACLVDDPTGAYSVSGGDLHRTLGSPGRLGPVVQRLPIDLLDIETDDGDYTAVAHVLIRRGWWRGRVVAVCNADHLGIWNVAPRAHPGDGRFDVVDVSAAMPLRARWEARRRLPTGTHLPHPLIRSFTATSWTWEDPDGAQIRVDGVDIGRRRRIVIRIRPDGGAVHV